MKQKRDDMNSVVINKDQYNVEIAKDFTINEVPENIVKKNQEEITGYTAGLITRDLVSKGEELVKNNHRNKR